jgi:hypothetical protein
VLRRCVLHRKQAPSKQDIPQLLGESGLRLVMRGSSAAAAGAVLVLGNCRPHLPCLQRSNSSRSGHWLQAFGS